MARSGHHADDLDPRPAGPVRAETFADRALARPEPIREELIDDGDTRRCTVYDARPRQCRTWPFWDSNLRTPEDWEETCRVCPGSGTGRLYQIDQIESQRKVMRI